MGLGARIGFRQSLILGFVVAAGLVTLLSSGGTKDKITSTVCTFPHQYVRTGSLVKLDGRCGDFTAAASDDAVMHYRWKVTSKPADSSVFFASYDLLTGFVADVDGDYEVTYQTGTQSQVLSGDTPITTIHVTASTGNARPMAEAGAYQEVAVGDTVQLDGSGSDADDNTLSYAWQFQAGSATSTLSSTSSASPTFVASNSGEYTLDLTVNDGAVNSQANAVLIRAADTNTSRPVAIAGSDQVITLGSQVQLDGSNSYSAYGRPLSYQWRMISRPSGSIATLSDSTAAQPSFIADVAGAYLVRLVVNDGINDSVRSLDDVYQDRLVVVAGNNRLPIADGGPDHAVNTGVVATMDGSGSSDPEMATLSYQWTIIKQPSGSTATLASTDMPSTSLTPDRDGDYLVRLVVNDGTNDSDPDIVRVSASSLTGSTSLTLLTGLPYAPPASELPTNIQIDTDASDTTRVVSPADETPGNFSTAMQVTYASATEAIFAPGGPGWSIISPASLTIDQASTPTFILQRTSDGMYYKFVIDFTVLGNFTVQIDALQAWRCGTSQVSCP